MSTHNTMTNRERLLKCFLEALEAIQSQELGLLELRPRTKSVEEIVMGDYDFVIDRFDLPRILRKFLNSALNHGVHVEVTYSTANKRIVTLIANRNRVTIELWLNIELSSSSVNGRRLQYPGSQLLEIVKGNPQSELTFLAALYLTHLHLKLKDLREPLQRRRIQEFGAGLKYSPLEGADQLERMYDELTSSIMSGGEPNLLSANREVIAWLASKGLRSRKSGHSAVKTRLRRIRETDIMIPIVGPDGSGKSYLAARLVSERPSSIRKFRYKRFFRNFEYGILVRLLNLFFPRDHANQIDEKLAGYLILKSVALSMFYGPKIKGKKSALLVDRYGWDYLLKGIRQEGRSPKRIMMVNFLKALIPQPRKCVVVAAKVETILCRKQELTAEKIEFIYGWYAKLAAEGRSRRFFFYNSEPGVDLSGSDVLDFVG